MQRTQEAAPGSRRSPGDQVTGLLSADTGVASPNGRSGHVADVGGEQLDESGRGGSAGPRGSARCGVAIWQSIIGNPRAGISSHSRLSATFEASRSMLNIDSPKNTRAERHAVEPADQALASARSRPSARTRAGGA